MRAACLVLVAFCLLGEAGNLAVAANAVGPAAPGAAEAGASSGVARLVEQRAAQFVAFLREYETDLSDLTALDNEVLHLLRQISRLGLLEPVVSRAFDLLVGLGKVPGSMANRKVETVGRIVNMTNAELQARGRTPFAFLRRYQTWDQIADRQRQQIGHSAFPPAGPDTPSRLEEPAFLQEFEAVTGSRFVAALDVRPLQDGPASFPERFRLIAEASSSIHIITWAIYDDATGWETARRLVARAGQGVDVRVIVDEQTANLIGFGEVLEFLRAGGVPVVTWRNPHRPYDGQHRKVMIVDGRFVLAGGMNFGDTYSHRGPPETPRWRDTDVLLAGAAAVEGERLFASLWNEQVSLRLRQPYPAVAVPPPPPVPDAGDTGPKAALVSHTPNDRGDDTVLLAVLKAISGATRALDIANAYYIRTPALEQALLQAQARGVRVRLLTNSAESVDEPIVSMPIADSLLPLLRAGLEVYVKTGAGATLHSKVIVVDDAFAMVMSYNLHPRSLRYEGEMAYAIRDARAAREFREAFERDIAAARRVHSEADLEIHWTPMARMAYRLFFDQL
jgi:cardiolipin synthase A/B